MGDLWDAARDFIRERRAMFSTIATLGAVACFVVAWQTCQGG